MWKGKTLGAGEYIVSFYYNRHIWSNYAALDVFDGEFHQQRLDPAEYLQTADFHSNKGELKYNPDNVIVISDSLIEEWDSKVTLDTNTLLLDLRGKV